MPLRKGEWEPQRASPERVVFASISQGGQAAVQQKWKDFSGTSAAGGLSRAGFHVQESLRYPAVPRGVVAVSPRSIGPISFFVFFAVPCLPERSAVRNTGSRAHSRSGSMKSYKKRGRIHPAGRGHRKPGKWELWKELHVPISKGLCVALVLLKADKKDQGRRSWLPGVLQGGRSGNKNQGI